MTNYKVMSQEQSETTSRLIDCYLTATSSMHASFIYDSRTSCKNSKPLMIDDILIDLISFYFQFINMFIWTSNKPDKQLTQIHPHPTAADLNIISSFVIDFKLPPHQHHHSGQCNNTQFHSK